jgi:uncharacterized protein YerC
VKKQLKNNSTTYINNICNFCQTYFYFYRSILMDELLKSLLESDVLSAETKTQLAEAFQTKVNEAIEQAKQETEVKVRAELTEQFVAEKEAIVEAIDTKVEDFLSKHLNELYEEIATFRDLEADYAARLVEEKKNIAETVKTDFAELIDQLDAFNTKCLEEEFAEFEASIEEVKKLNFGKEIYEAVAKTFEQKFADNNDTLNQLKEAEAKLATTQKALTESTKTLDSIKRSQEMSKVLEPLQGRAREVMEAILKSTATEKLAEAYEKFIPHVLHESSKSEKESGSASPVLAEGKDAPKKVEETKVVTGDTPITESTTDAGAKTGLSQATVSRIQRLAGND